MCVGPTCILLFSSQSEQEIIILQVNLNSRAFVLDSMNGEQYKPFVAVIENYCMMVESKHQRNHRE